MNPRLLLIDGNNLYWRVGSAIQIPYGGEYGFWNALCRLKERYSAETIVVWDSWCQWRRQTQTSYKANRDEHPEVKEKMYAERDAFVEKLSFAIPAYYMNGEEADDVIAYVCATMPQREIYIYSVDGDMHQLLRYDHVRVLRPHPKQQGQELIYDKMSIEHLTECPAEWLSWLLSLTGCTSDNVPGCRIPRKLLINILKSSPSQSIEDVRKTGSHLLSPGYKAMWEKYFESGQAARTRTLVDLTQPRSYPEGLKIFYQPNKQLLAEYLNERAFFTIRDRVLSMFPEIPS